MDLAKWLEEKIVGKILENNLNGADTETERGALWVSFAGARNAKY